MKEIAYSKQGLKALRKMPRPTAMRLREKIELYATDPAALANNVTALEGQPGLRLRVGDWRVLFSEGEDAIDVVAIAPRGAAYD